MTVPKLFHKCCVALIFAEIHKFDPVFFKTVMIAQYLRLQTLFCQEGTKKVLMDLCDVLFRGWIYFHCVLQMNVVKMEAVVMK